MEAADSDGPAVVEVSGSGDSGTPPSLAAEKQPTEERGDEKGRPEFSRGTEEEVAAHKRSEEGESDKGVAEVGDLLGKDANETFEFDPLEKTLEERELIDEDEMLNQSAERELLSHSAEERELQARDLSSCSNDETFDVDFLIMDEVRDEDDEDEKPSKGQPTEASAEGSAIKPDTKSETDTVEEASDVTTTKNDAADDEERARDAQSDDCVTEDDVAMDEAAEKVLTVNISTSDDDISLGELQRKHEGSDSPSGNKGSLLMKLHEKMLEEEGTNDSTEGGPGGSEVSEGPNSKAGDKAEKQGSQQSSSLTRDPPVVNGASSMEGADDSQEDAIRSETGAECNGTSSSLLKRALSPECWLDSGSDVSKKIKSEVISDGEDNADAAATSASAEANKVVVMTRGELEKYVSQRVQESLAKQEQTMLQPMEKKCDTLHRALERWRRRSFQLQKQLNEFVCEQEKCAGARKARGTQRSVGVCVRMPPLKSQTPTPTLPAMRTSSSTAPTTTTSHPLLAARPTVSISTPAAKGSPTPTVRVLTLPPATSGSSVLNRLPTQSTAGGGNTGVPVPMQLITNTASPTSQVKSVSIPVTAGSSTTVVRTVAMMPSSTSAVTTSAGVKVIDLTQEEDANLARFVAVSTSSGAVSTVQKIAVSSSGIPMLSAAPTSLVQMAPVSARNVGTTSIGPSAAPSSAGAIRINHPVVTPQRVTYLLPNLAPNVVVGQREGAPRLTNPPVHMPTILFRMTTPPNNLTTVQGNTISVGNLATQAGGAGTTNLMVAPPGTQVRMIRAPAPMALQKSGNTFTLPPGTTVVRAPATLPSGIVTTTKAATEPAVTAQRVVVTGTVAPPGADTIVTTVGRHPAPLPPMPRYLDDPKKKRLPPKPALKITKAASARPAASKKKPPVRSMDQLLTEWQAYLNTEEDDTKPRVGRRPADLPLRLECNCRLGTCRYGTLPTSFKEKIYAEFRRYGPKMQTRTLLKRMRAEGLLKRLQRAAKRGRGRGGTKVDAGDGGRRRRCKWAYYLEAPGQYRRKVCKAAFMAVHGISEKRVREAQLKWMKENKARSPTSRSGDELSAPEDDADEAEDTDSGEERGRDAKQEEDGTKDDLADDEDEFLDTSALEPICDLEEEADNLVLHLSPGAFDGRESDES